MFQCKWSVISEHKACQHLGPFLFDWLKKIRHVCGHPVVYIRKKRLRGIWCFWVPLLPDLFLPRVFRHQYKMFIFFCLFWELKRLPQCELMVWILYTIPVFVFLLYRRSLWSSSLESCFWYTSERCYSTPGGMRSIPEWRNQLRWLRCWHARWNSEII